jgi:hypothetical protein
MAKWVYLILSVLCVQPLSNGCMNNTNNHLLNESEILFIGAPHSLVIISISIFILKPDDSVFDQVVEPTSQLLQSVASFLSSL